MDLQLGRTDLQCVAHRGHTDIGNATCFIEIGQLLRRFDAAYITQDSGCVDDCRFLCVRAASKISECPLLGR
ncbi:MAG: hypothetical protein CMM46_00795 [Rhodospirillaceae bacterium]|nr:hypothetical protein [Rhodospirillaceae bacterium]